MTRAQRGRWVREEFIKGMEFLYDLLDSGWSVEELEIELDIAAAGGGLPESVHAFCRGGLDLIRTAREEGFGRNEAVAFLRDNAKALCEVIERDGGDDFYRRGAKAHTEGNWPYRTAASSLALPLIAAF